MNKDQLRTLKKSLHLGQPIDGLQWLELQKILETILEGYDVRKSYGINAKPGTPRTTHALQTWMVLHFLALCADEPDEFEKAHRGTVAQAWGKKDGQIGKLVRARRASVEHLVAIIGIKAILESVPDLQKEYKRMTPNPR